MSIDDMVKFEIVEDDAEGGLMVMAVFSYDADKEDQIVSNRSLATALLALINQEIRELVEQEYHEDLETWRLRAEDEWKETR